MNFEEIYPNIIVYRDLYENVEELFNKTKFIEKEADGSYLFEKWSKWFIFGTYSSINCGFDSSWEADNECKLAEKYCYENISNASRNAVEHYMNYYNVDWPENSFVTNPNIARYTREEDLSQEDKTPDDNLRMQFHTDYPIGEWYWPGRKFLLTCNTYINDNYDGGEVVFLHRDDIISYKPKAGEVLVFPSGSPLFPKYPNRQPYFHAVNSPSINDKYFVRTYLQYDITENETWDDLRSKFDTDEEWEQFLKHEGRSGHNTAAVYMGDMPNLEEEIFDMDEAKFLVSKYEPGMKFWVSTTSVPGKLYDFDGVENFLFRDDHCVPKEED